MDNLLLDLVITIIGGGIGGFIAHQLGWRLFRKQTIYQTEIQDYLKRRDALRDALALSHEVSRSLNFGWQRLGEEDADTANRLEEMRVQLNSAASLFLDDDLAQKGLFGLRNLIGIDVAKWQKSKVDPFVGLSEDQKNLEQALAEINKRLDRL